MGDVVQPVGALSPTASWKFQSTASKVSAARYIVVDFCWAHGLPDERLNGVGVAVSEVVTNAVQHAYPGADGEIEITATVSDYEILITVTDAGVGIAPEDLLANRQMGLRIAEGFTDGMDFRAPADGSGLIVELRFPRQRTGIGPPTG